MSVESRDIIQTGEILQDSMPATSTLNSGGENLTYANSPFTLAKLYRWLVGISKAIFGEKTRRNGAKRIQGLEQTLTGTITSSGTAVTGSGTLFQTELFVGAFIAGTANEYREVLSIASDTSLTLVSAFSVDIGSAQNTTRLQSLAERVDGVEEYVNEAFNGDFGDWLASSFSSPASDTETANNWFVNYDGTIGTFAVSREAFTVGQTDVPGEPQYYLRWNHTSAGSAQTIKRIRHKISGVRSFAGQTIQVTFYAKFASAAAVTVGATQYFGSGGGPSADVAVTAKSRTLTTTFARYTVTLSIPSISGKTIGTSGDALYIDFNLPLNATCDFQLANVSAYKGTAEIPFKLAVYTQRLKSTLKAYLDTLYPAKQTYITAQATPTRVTGAAPDALGEYRSYKRSVSSSRTYSETNGAPGTAPNSTDGYKFYNGGAFGGADSNNEPTKYEIFIGLDKTFQLEFYRSAGRTGVIFVDPFYNWGGAFYDGGISYNYDPATGVLTLLQIRWAGQTPVLGCDGTGIPVAGNIFFDIKC